MKRKYQHQHTNLSTGSMRHTNQNEIQSLLGVIRNIENKQSRPPICNHRNTYTSKYPVSDDRKALHVTSSNTMLKDIEVGPKDKLHRLWDIYHNNTLFSFDDVSDDESLSESSLNNDEDSWKVHPLDTLDDFHEDDELQGLAFSDDVDVGIDTCSIVTFPCFDESEDDELIGLSLLCPSNDEDLSITKSLGETLCCIESIFTPTLQLKYQRTYDLVADDIDEG